MQEERNKKGEEREKGDLMRSLYDQVPYPQALAEEPPQGIPLLEHWINGIYGFNRPVVFDGGRILVAGCGSGEEAMSLAQHYPESDVLGLDFSEKSIAIARRSAREMGVTNVRFEVVDLTDDSWPDPQNLYDFILCHGVADYVTDVPALLSNFASALREGGLIYLSVNSPYHPAERIRGAMSNLGVAPNAFTASESQRQKLTVISKLLGEHTGIRNVSNAAVDYLKVDIFPPIAHHFSIDEWEAYGKKAGLNFCASLEALSGLLQLNDNELPPLYDLDRASLSTWMLKLRQPPGMQLLFGKKMMETVDFKDLSSLWNWKPRLVKSVIGIPEMNSPPDQAMHLTLQFHGLPDFVIYSSAYDLEVLRNCSGELSLKEIMDGIPVKGNREALRSTLFRAYHYGILSS